MAGAESFPNISIFIFNPGVYIILWAAKLCLCCLIVFWNVRDQRVRPQSLPQRGGKYLLEKPLLFFTLCLSHWLQHKAQSTPLALHFHFHSNTACKLVLTTCHLRSLKEAFTLVVAVLFFVFLQCATFKFCYSFTHNHPWVSSFITLKLLKSHIDYNVLHGKMGAF